MSPHPHQLWLTSVFLTVVMLIGMRWDPVVSWWRKYQYCVGLLCYKSGMYPNPVTTKRQWHVPQSCDNQKITHWGGWFPPGWEPSALLTSLPHLIQCHPLAHHPSHSGLLSVPQSYQPQAHPRAFAPAIPSASHALLLGPHMTNPIPQVSVNVHWLSEWLVAHNVRAGSKITHSCYHSTPRGGSWGPGKRRDLTKVTGGPSQVSWPQPGAHPPTSLTWRTSVPRSGPLQWQSQLIGLRGRQHIISSQWAFPSVWFVLSLATR